MGSSQKSKTQTNIIATPPVVQKTPIYTFSKTLSRGDKNKQVEHLQVLLASESSIYQKGLITGYFGLLTENAVKTFQKRYRLPATGAADEDVSVLQQFLINVEAYPEALLTGYFGPLTRSAVQRFQREQNIAPASGYFGPITKKRMLNLIRLRSVSF